VELDAVDLGRHQVLPQKVRGLVSVDGSPGHVDEDEVIVTRLRREGAPRLESPHKVGVDGHRSGSPRLFPVQVDDAVLQVQTAPGEGRDVPKRLVIVLHSTFHLFDLAPKRLFAAPSCPGEEAVKDAAPKVDTWSALLVDFTAAE
jgi:hypothetical protein